MCKWIFLCFGQTEPGCNLCVFSLVFVLGFLCSSRQPYYSVSSLFIFLLFYIFPSIYFKDISNNRVIKESHSFGVFLQVRTFKGHTNEKNFVGLTVNSEYIACGSETNEVFVYHKVSKIWKLILSPYMFPGKSLKLWDPHCRKSPNL